MIWTIALGLDVYWVNSRLWFLVLKHVVYSIHVYWFYLCEGLRSCQGLTLLWLRFRNFFYGLFILTWFWRWTLLFKDMFWWVKSLIRHVFWIIDCFIWPCVFDRLTRNFHLSYLLNDINILELLVHIVGLYQKYYCL